MFKNNNPLAMQRELTGVTKALGRIDVTTTFQGVGAHASHGNINVPALKLDADLTLTQQRIIRGYHIHETGHVLHTNDVIWQRTSMSDEDRRTWNAIEDVYIERKINDQYAGALKNLEQTVDSVLGRENEMFQNCKRTKEELDYAVLQLSRHAMGYETEALDEYVRDLPDWLRNEAEKFVPAAIACNSTSDTLKLARKITGAKAKLKEPEDEDGEGERRGDGRGEEQDGKGKGKGDGGDEADDKAEDEDGEGEGGDGTSDDEREGEGKPQSANSSQGKDKATTNAERPDAEFGQTKLEDVLRQELGDAMADRRHDDGIRSDNNSAQTMSSDAWLRATIGEHGQKRNSHLGTWQRLYNQDTLSMSGDIRKQSASVGRLLISEEKRAWHGGKTEGRLDRRRLSGVVAGSEDVFAEQVVQRGKDVLVTVMMDASGSMDFAAARRSLVVLNETLKRTTIMYRLVMWSSGHVNLVIKTEAQRGSLPIVTQCIGSLGTWSGGTTPEKSILPELVHMNGADVDRKIMIFCTDGCFQRSEFDYLERYAKLSAQHGVETYGVFIGRGANQGRWNRVYGENGWFEVDDSGLAQSMLNGLEGLLLKSAKTLAA